MPFESESDMREALSRLDQAGFWPKGAHAELILIGGAVRFLHGVDDRRTVDLDAHLKADRDLYTRLEVVAEDLGISFRGGQVMWASADVEDKALPVPWTFEHLAVRYLDVDDCV